MSESALPPFMTAAEAFDVKDLATPWRWLIPPSATPLFITVFGDWVFGAPDGGLWALSVLEGTFSKIAASGSEYNRLKASFEWLDETFIAGWQEIALRHGLVPAVHECIGWKVHPALGRPFEKENLKIFSMRVYQYLMGQLHQQLQQGRRV
jgi:hypothetical protein